MPGMIATRVVAVFAVLFIAVPCKAFHSVGIRSVENKLVLSPLCRKAFPSALSGRSAHQRAAAHFPRRSELRALPLPDAENRKELISASVFVLIDIAFRRIFTASKITFPSSLAACSCLFFSMLALPQSASSRLFQVLQPGALILAKWLPVFFVPSLVTLPLGDGLGSGGELAKVGAVVVGGFLLSLFSTAFAVALVRGKPKAATVSDSTVAGSDGEAVNQKPPFTDGLFLWLLVTMGLSAVSVVTDGTRRGIFLLATTLSSFVFGSRLLSIKKIVHPLVTCTGLTWTSMQLMTSLCPGTSFTSWLQVYKSTAGRLLLFGLGPAVVSLATSMYERRKLMRDNLKAVATAILVSTFSGLFGTAVAVRGLGLASHSVRLSLLSRNITSPLAMAIASMLGADVSMAVSMVVVTGLLGANFGGNLLSLCGIEDGVARGLAVGSAAHGLGTAALTQEKEAFPFAAIAMALTATAATVTVSIPFFQKLLVRIALGS